MFKRAAILANELSIFFEFLGAQKLENARMNVLHKLRVDSDAVRVNFLLD